LNNRLINKFQKNAKKQGILIHFVVKFNHHKKNITKQKEGGFPVVNFTTNTYKMKREILTYSNKISKLLFKPEKKFTADMTYGMLAAGSCLLTDVADKLHEPAKKINTVDRLSKHLEKGIPPKALASYMQTIKNGCRQTPLFI
jgi:hypothetical protein